MYSLSFFLPVLTWLMPWFGAVAVAVAVVVLVVEVGTFALVGAGEEEDTAGLA